MTDKELVLDLAMNLNRVGNFVADDFTGKQKRIQTFLDDIDEQLKQLKPNNKKFNSTYQSFLKYFNKSKDLNNLMPQDIQNHAEDMMTWGNILTHRSKLLES